MRRGRPVCRAQPGGLNPKSHALVCLQPAKSRFVQLGMEGKHVEQRAKADSWPDSAAQLRDLLKELAGQLQPYPAFMNTTSIQAIEVVPQGLGAPDRGCVVVCPDGQLYDLNLYAIPGPPGVSDVDQVEELAPLDVPPEEYILYADAAVQALKARLEAIYSKSSTGPAKGSPKTLVSRWTNS